MPMSALESLDVPMTRMSEPRLPDLEGAAGTVAAGSVA